MAITEQDNKRGAEELHSRIDELRAANYSLAEKMENSLKRLDAGLSELSALSTELKSFKSDGHRQGIVRDVTESVGNMFSKHPDASEVAVVFGKEVSKELDAKLSKLAELEAELLKKSDAALTASEETKKQFLYLSEWAGEQDKRLVAVSDSIAELKSSLAASKQHAESHSTRISSVAAEIRKSVDQAVGEIKGSVNDTLEHKLMRLAELEAELYKKELENSEVLVAINENLGKSQLSENREEIMVNALGNMSSELKALQTSVKQEVAAKQEENYAAMRAALLKIVENQNRLNEVLADSLTSLLDSTEANKNTLSEVKLHLTEMKSQIDLEKTGDLEKRVAARLAKRLTDG